MLTPGGRNWQLGYPNLATALSFVRQSVVVLTWTLFAKFKTEASLPALLSIQEIDSLLYFKFTTAGDQDKHPFVHHLFNGV
jgi:hypothetical protein